MAGREIRVEGDTVYFSVGRRLKATAMVDLADIEIVRRHWFAFVRAETNAFVRAAPLGQRGGARLARILLDPPPDKMVDHINGNPLDNRRANLRVVTAQDNCRNRAKRAGTTSSRFKGVSKDGAKWLAVIYRNYKQVRLGKFLTEREAAEAYDNAAREMFGLCAAVNFPASGEQAAHRVRTVEFHEEVMAGG
jgi:hypothetical protein